MFLSNVQLLHVHMVDRLLLFIVLGAYGVASSGWVAVAVAGAEEVAVAGAEEVAVAGANARLPVTVEIVQTIMNRNYYDG